MTLAELNTQYTALRAQYTTLANQAAANPGQIQTLLPQIQSVNQQIAAVLDQMLAQMQYARDGPNSETYRAELVEQLARIQLDYNGLKTNTDALQTLRRIRSFQDTSWQSTLFLYIGLFVLVAGLFALLVMVRRHASTSTMAPSPSPTAMAPLT
jgi:ribosomal protein L29